MGKHCNNEFDVYHQCKTAYTCVACIKEFDIKIDCILCTARLMHHKPRKKIKKKPVIEDPPPPPKLSGPSHPAEEMIFLFPEELHINKKYKVAVTPLTPKEDSDLDQDVKTTKEIRVPLFISEKNTVLDGHHRLAKAIKYDIEQIPCIRKKFNGPLEEYSFVAKINLLRRHMNEAQRIINSRLLFQIETKLAAQRKKIGTIAPYGAKGKTSEKVAKLIGVSPRNFERGSAILKSKNKNLIADWEAGKTKTSTTFRRLRKSEIEKSTTIPPLPTGKYNVMELDPNWAYRSSFAGTDGNAGGESHFLALSPEEILKTWIPKYEKILARDAVVFLWVTTPLLYEIIQLGILEGLGCKYKTMISWHKILPKEIFGGRGLGYWFLGEMEHCLVGIRGKIEPFRCDSPNFLETPHDTHSKKPIEFKELIEKATQNIPNRKMFEGYSRQKRTGWFTHGAEV